MPDLISKSLKRSFEFICDRALRLGWRAPTGEKLKPRHRKFASSSNAANIEIEQQLPTNCRRRPGRAVSIERTSQLLCQFLRHDFFTIDIFLNRTVLESASVSGRLLSSAEWEVLSQVRYCHTAAALGIQDCSRSIAMPTKMF
jgi:hypothetical protein